MLFLHDVSCDAEQLHVYSNVTIYFLLITKILQTAISCDTR